MRPLKNGGWVTSRQGTRLNQDLIRTTKTKKVNTFRNELQNASSVINTDGI